MIWTVLQVALGGALGASSRYLTGVAAVRLLGQGFPFGTLIVNVVGSFLMGLLFVVLTERGQQGAMPFLLTGVLGGFTTFSAFSLDAMTLFQKGQVGLALVYVLASVVVSILALALGLMVAKGAVA
ncbi:fluoride efflux transporter CrcB [Actibacterium pelagium]|uniref:Fluoride-specific ion channel FluC n=1 Tax=Actibacterium pelagium TaxID=2029103 RepID=A0A917EHF6_9RHOB|nr:fluoride efflux transporter CrcB [Actibacterium pelagium]GGE36641.1 putative fluoride ion transporter CrcB [Actibacterium pelagium]